MNQSQVESFLRAPRNAIVATNPEAGAPHMTPVWYLYERGRLYISISVHSVKYRHLQRDPRLSVCIDGCHSDARTVMFTGTAELLPGNDPLAAKFLWRIIRRYHETETAARQYAEQVRDVVSALIVMTPDRIISQDFNHGE